MSKLVKTAISWIDIAIFWANIGSCLVAVHFLVSGKTNSNSTDLEVSVSSNFHGS